MIDTEDEPTAGKFQLAFPILGESRNLSQRNIRVVYLVN